MQPEPRKQTSTYYCIQLISEIDSKNRRSGLHWADGRRIIDYPASKNMFVWEARKLLFQEAARAIGSRRYGFYLDGDIAKF